MNNKELKKLSKEKIEDNGFEILGAFHWATIRKNSFNKEDFLRIMKENDIPAKYAPSLTQKSCFLRALVELEKSNSENRLLRKVNETEEDVIFQVTLESKSEDNADGLVYEKETLISYSKITKEISSANEDVKQKVMELVAEEENNFKEGDLRAVVSKYLNNSLKAIRAKKTGGIHFVTRDKLEDLKKLHNFLLEIGVMQDDINLFHVPDIENEKKQLVKSFVDEINECCKELKEEIETLKQKKSSPKIMEKKMKKIKSLREKILLYQAGLGIQVDKLEEKIKQNENLLLEAIGITKETQIQEPSEELENLSEKLEEPNEGLEEHSEELENLSEELEEPSEELEEPSEELDEPSEELDEPNEELEDLSKILSEEDSEELENLSEEDSDELEKRFGSLANELRNLASGFRSLDEEQNKELDKKLDELNKELSNELEESSEESSEELDKLIHALEIMDEEEEEEEDDDDEKTIKKLEIANK